MNAFYPETRLKEIIDTIFKNVHAGESTPEISLAEVSVIFYHVLRNNGSM